MAAQAQDPIHSHFSDSDLSFLASLFAPATSQPPLPDITPAPFVDDFDPVAWEEEREHYDLSD
jgi:hypothetical protein